VRSCAGTPDHDLTCCKGLEDNSTAQCWHLRALKQSCSRIHACYAWLPVYLLCDAPGMLRVPEGHRGLE
jgi:hypothetical protein